MINYLIDENLHFGEIVKTDKLNTVAISPDMYSWLFPNRERIVMFEEDKPTSKTQKRYKKRQSVKVMDRVKKRVKSAKVS